MGNMMGCLESKPKVALDDFVGSDKSTARVDRDSIPAVWAKKFPQFKLIEKDLEELVPSEPITKENEEKFGDFMGKFLNLAAKKEDMFKWREEDHTGFCKGDGWYESTAVPLVKKVFNNYDVNGDGVLDKEESAIFFSHFADEFARVIPWFGGNVDENPLLRTAKKQKEEANIKREETLQAYKANKEAKDKAVFAVMDVNKDGKLQLQEVLDSFRTGSDLRKEVLTTFGLHMSELGDPQ